MILLATEIPPAVTLSCKREKQSSDFRRRCKGRRPFRYRSGNGLIRLLKTDYTWRAYPDFRSKVVSTEREACETLVLDGQPYRRTLEWDGKPLSGQNNTPSL
jgi:hypothetical protein